MTGPTSVVTCDDGNPDTDNDVQTVLDCDNSICVPCAGTPVDCSNGTTSVVTCDDGDDCTENDVQTILDSDNTICVPCAGTPVDCNSGSTIFLPCDDGDACTINDVTEVLECDNSIVCNPCMGTISNPVPPNVDSQFTVCLGDDLAVTSSSQGTLNWYDANPNTGAMPVFAGDIFNPNLDNIGIENYWVLADVNGCESDAATFQIEVISNPEVLDIQIIQPSCTGGGDGSIELPMIVGGTPPYEVFLNGNSAGNQLIFNNLNSGNYELMVVDQNLCQWEETIILNEPQTLEFTLAVDNTIVTLGESVQVDILTSQPITNIESIVWSDTIGLSCLDCFNPTLIPLTTATYSVEITDINGCVASDEISITVNNVFPIFTPNIFSPNNDGFNDFFTVYSAVEGMKINYLRIFDRQGNVVFESTDDLPNLMTGWDGSFRGKVMNPGVFTFVFEVENMIGGKEIFKGSVTLIR